MKKRGQIGIEYIIIVGFVTIIVISLFIASHYHSRQVEGIINTNQVDALVREIVDTAESVYYFGEPSKSTVKAYLPKGINEIIVGPNELTFRVRTRAGVTDISYPTAITVQGSILPSAGLRSITIEAREGYAWINGT